MTLSKLQKIHNDHCEKPHKDSIFPCEHYHHDMVIEVLIAIAQKIESLEQTISLIGRL